jgi:hypothetical protein
MSQEEDPKKKLEMREKRNRGISCRSDRQNPIACWRREGCGEGFNDMPKVERGITSSLHSASHMQSPGFQNREARISADWHNLADRNYSFVIRTAFQQQPWLLGCCILVTLSLIWPTRCQSPQSTSMCWSDVGVCSVSKAWLCDTQISGLQQILLLNGSCVCCLLVCLLLRCQSSKSSRLCPHAQSFNPSLSPTRPLPQRIRMGH